MNTHTNTKTSQQIATGPMMSGRQGPSIRRGRGHHHRGDSPPAAGQWRSAHPRRRGRGRPMGRLDPCRQERAAATLPLTLGSDLAGIIEAVGPGVSEFAVGDAVFGVTNPRFIGAYADYALASAGMIAKKPVWLGDVEAASLPVIAVTAWQALFDQAKLVRGQSVLVHGAAGNVGAYAVQFARRAGLEVIATASARDSERVKELGADRVIDRSQPFEEQVHDVDAVIDLVGGDAQNRSFQVLRAGGTLISAVSQPDQEEATRRGVEAAFFLVNVTTADFDGDCRDARCRRTRHQCRRSPALCRRQTGA